MADVQQHSRAGVNGLGGGPLAIGDLTQKTPASDTLRTLVGDSRQVLGPVAPGTVQCCVTSVLSPPPYWGLRNDDHGEQIGAESSSEEYVSNLVTVFRVHRALRDDGTMARVGDGYTRNGGTGRSGPTMPWWAIRRS